MTNTEATTRWARFTATRSNPYDGYRLNDRIEITDNGAGPGKSALRWAVMVDGRWVANFDTLAEAKRFGADR